MKDLTEKEIELLIEMINGGTFSGQVLEIAASLKEKISNEMEKRIKG
jgi:hypothetical protein